MPHNVQRMHTYDSDSESTGNIKVTPRGINNINETKQIWRDRDRLQRNIQKPDTSKDMQFGRMSESGNEYLFARLNTVEHKEFLSDSSNIPSYYVKKPLVNCKYYIKKDSTYDLNCSSSTSFISSSEKSLSSSSSVVSSSDSGEVTLETSDSPLSLSKFSKSSSSVLSLESDAWSLNRSHSIGKLKNPSHDYDDSSNETSSDFLDDILCDFTELSTDSSHINIWSDLHSVKRWVTDIRFHAEIECSNILHSKSIKFGNKPQL